MSCEIDSSVFGPEEVLCHERRQKADRYSGGKECPSPSSRKQEGWSHKKGGFLLLQAASSASDSVASLEQTCLPSLFWAALKLIASLCAPGTRGSSSGGFRISRRWTPGSGTLPALCCVRSWFDLGSSASLEIVVTAGGLLALEMEHQTRLCCGSCFLLRRTAIKHDHDPLLTAPAQ